VVVTMGDGGLGIGGAHLLAACRRNLDMTLLVLNNFNFGMTGGQFSCTTPQYASMASGFLNTIEKPMDVCSVCVAAGAPFAARSSVYSKDLADLLVEAISFEGFSLVDIWGICPGRYLKRNALTPQKLEESLRGLPSFDRPVPENMRREYGDQYRAMSAAGPGGNLHWQRSESHSFVPPVKGRREIVLLGAAGERVISAGSLLAHAAMLAGMHASQKNDYNITVMRGPSVTELIICSEPVTYPGVDAPDIIVALSDEGVKRRADVFGAMKPKGRIILAKGVDIPAAAGQVFEADFDACGIRKKERALAALSLLAGGEDPITLEMLHGALRLVLDDTSLGASLDLLNRAASLSVRPLQSS
jgi:2-oxoglutarate ferredoxin oxidoreductase subunit beta